LTTGAGQVAWQGTVTVVFYDGLVYFWLRNPVLNLAKGGAATLTATVGGYGSDRNDASQWVAFPERTVVVAQGKAALKAGGTELKPDYQGVVLPRVKDQVLGTGSTNPGAWPAGFVDFQTSTGLSQYWYSTGNNHDYRKPPDPLYISWDATKSIAELPPDGSEWSPPGKQNNEGFPPAPSPSAPGPGGNGPGGKGSGGGAGGAGTGSSAGGPTSPNGEATDGVGQGPASDGWDMVVEPLEFKVASQGLVPEAAADRRGRRLLVEIALLTLICTSGLGLVGWRRGWFKAQTKG